MQVPGDDLLPGSAFADDEDGARDRCHPRDLVLPLPRAVTEQGAVGRHVPLEAGDLPGEPASLEAGIDLVYHALHRLGLVDEAVGPEADRLNAAVVVAGARVDDHRSVDAPLAHG